MRWHQRMAAVIESADVYAHHLVTTSFCGNDYTRSPSVQTKEIFDGVYQLPEIDFAQTHAYQGPMGNKLQDAAEEISRGSYGGCWYLPYVYEGGSARRDSEPDTNPRV